MNIKLKHLFKLCLEQISFKIIDLLVWSSMLFTTQLLKKSKN